MSRLSRITCSKKIRPVTGRSSIWVSGGPVRRGERVRQDRQPLTQQRVDLLPRGRCDRQPKLPVHVSQQPARVLQLRAAVYHAVPFADRAAAQLRIADTVRDQPDRYAWHLAAAALEPDERLATLLEDTAARTQRRGGDQPTRMPVQAQGAGYRRPLRLRAAPGRLRAPAWLMLPGALSGVSAAGRR
jgi:hypothetical protein